MDVGNDFLREKRKEEYQYQHFEFTTSMYKTEVKEMVMSIIEDAAGQMEKSLICKYPTKSEDIKLATRTLIEEYADKTEEFIHSVEGKLDNTFFAIPSHVLLPEDKPQIKQYSKEDVRQVQRELMELEKKIKQVNFMEAKLQQAVKSSEKLMKTHSNLLHECSRSKPTKDFYKEMEKLKSKVFKLNEGKTYISDLLMNSNSSECDENSVKQENATTEHCFKLLVD